MIAEIPIAMSGEREDLSSANALCVEATYSELSEGLIYHFYSHTILHSFRAETFLPVCTAYKTR